MYFQGNTKLCRYQAELYPSSYWRHVTGEGCYAYTAPSKLNFRFPRATCVAYENWKAYAIKYTGVSCLFQLSFQLPIFRFDYTISLLTFQFNGTAIFYDYTNENYTSLIFQSFTTPAYADDWMKCAKAAEECCDQHMDKTNVYPSKTSYRTLLLSKQAVRPRCCNLAGVVLFIFIQLLSIDNWGLIG